MKIHVAKQGSLALLSLLHLSAVAQQRSDTEAIPQSTHPLLWLAIVTLGIVALAVLWQFYKVRKAKREGTHSALSGGDIKTRPGTAENSKNRW